MRFGTMAAIGLAARSVAVATLWRQATGEGQNISVDVRKALRRFCGFFEGKWETVNGRGPTPGGYAVSPFLNMEHFFRETRDGRHVVALDIYPQILVRTLDFFSAAARVPNRSTTPYSNGTLWNWRRPRQPKGWFSRWCGRTRNSFANANIQRSSPTCR